VRARLPLNCPRDSPSARASPLTLYLDPNAVSRFSIFCAAFVGDNLDINAVDGNVAIIRNDKRNVTTPLTPE
jgi:hypothetical protein